LSQNLKRKKAELALLYAVPLLSNAEENSRLAGLQRRLQKEVLPYLKKLDAFSNRDYHEINQRIFTWGKSTGWLESEKQTGTTVSFCLDMIENSPIKYDDKIHKTLNDLAKHLEKGKALYPLSCAAGRIAQEKWQQVYKEEE